MRDLIRKRHPIVKNAETGELHHLELSPKFTQIIANASHQFGEDIARQAAELVRRQHLRTMRPRHIEAAIRLVTSTSDSPRLIRSSKLAVLRFRKAQNKTIKVDPDLEEEADA